MQVVNESKVLARFSNGHPQQIELVCPHCLREATFSPVAWHQHARLLAVAEAACPRCSGDVVFLLKFDRHDDQAPPILYIDPPASGRELVAGVDHLRTLSAPLGRTYESAVKLFNHAEWGASAITMRHFLDGLAKRLLAVDKRELPLTRQLDALVKDVDLAKPLQNIAQLLAPNGAIGHRFEDEATIDREVAAQLIELTEGLVSYLVVLPAMLAQTKASIDSTPVPLRREDVVEMRSRG